ncbi:oxygen-binding di-iron domain-containing protein [Nocardia stercoris]|uniref:MBL fold metallo-hydrolase n=1 Tax=Nocardia stercoris TaxID=2483361 RepID=A0A3M2L7W4_9NOCA|nr:MBL fold metallo-hydrolase [Nocardia stercoris]RMI33647.1 MBL fold metallo-hydrolase [Nocardia stercoris]
MTTVDEIAPRIYRISTYVPQAGPGGMVFNQYLLDADEPLLFHTGHRAMFPDVCAAIERVLPVSALRWITFGHVESDECGAMNEFLTAAPGARVAHGAIGCMVSLDHMADRPPRPLIDGEVIDLGGLRVRHLDTPHVPHGWEARVLFEETTGTLLCGDLFSQSGQSGALLDGGDLVGPAAVAEEMFHFSTLAPATPVIMESLAALSPSTLALMHGPAFRGDGAGALRDLAGVYRDLIATASAASV